MNNKTPIATLLVLHQADYDALQACIEAALRKLGLQQLDGLSIRDWIDKRRVAELESALRLIGNEDPVMHDALVALIAKVSKAKV